MTEVELYQRPRATIAVSERDVVDGWVTVVKDVAKLADHIADTDFVPKALRNRPAAIAACMLTGREIGIGPMQSMKVIHMVQGSPSLSAEFKRARALAAGHEIVFDEVTTVRCVVRGRRKGEDSWLAVTWTMDDAKRAKLAGKEVWQQHPRRMLQARASGELCDLKFPDCSWGLPTTEVLEDGDVIDGDVVEAEPKAIEPPQRTAQRRTRRAEQAGVSSSAPAADRQPAPATPAAAAQDGPPLPGEEQGTLDEPQAPASDDKHAKLVGVVQQHFKRLGYGDADRGTRLLDCERITGSGPLDSSSDLTAEQLSVVADTLARCKNREQLNALLNAGEKPGEAGDRAAERAFQAGDDG